MFDPVRAFMMPFRDAASRRLFLVDFQPFPARHFRAPEPMRGRFSTHPDVESPKLCGAAARCNGFSKISFMMAVAIRQRIAGKKRIPSIGNRTDHLTEK